MIVTKKAMPRRTFLRGMGVSLALPLLDAMSPALTRAAAPVVRLGFVYVPNGIIGDKWFPLEDGANFTFQSTMKPLEAYRDRLLVFSGLAQVSGRALGDGPGDHARAGATWLTGLVALARIRGEYFWWLTTWLAPLAAVTWTVVGVAIAGRRRHTLAVGLVAVLGFGAFVTHLDHARRDPYVNEYWGGVVDDLTDQAWPAFGGQPVFLDFEGDARAAGAVQAGIVDEWERREGDLRVPANFAMQMGRHRTAASPAGRTRLLLRVETRNDVAAPTAAELVAVASPLTAAEQAEQDRLVDRLTASLVEGGHDDLVPLLDTRLASVALASAPELEPQRADFERLADLRSRGERFALYALAG